MRKLLVVIVILLIANTIAYGQDVNAYIELLRSDVKTQRIAIIKEAMQFTGAESSAFWPVYKKYEYELDEINDERVELIKDYALNYNNLTDEKSEELIKKVFKWEEKRIKLKKKYFKKFKKTLSSTIAAKFFQLERQISLLNDLQIASQLPLIK